MKNQTLDFNSTKMVELNTTELQNTEGGLIFFVAGVIGGLALGYAIWG